MTDSDKKKKTAWIIKETESIEKTYTLGKKIGQPGQFGYARLAVEKKSGETRAVKVINKSRFSGGSDTAFHFAQLKAEIKVMETIKHDNVIRFYEVFEDQDALYIVMELASGGELFDRIQQKGHYSEKDAAGVLRQMFRGIQYLHSNKIAHCDLKPDNFLFLHGREDSPIKVIDFGMSKFVERRKYFQSFCGTPFYVAPEVIAGKYSEHCDLWSLGVVMFVMLFGYPPFYADQEKFGSFTDDKILSLVKKGFSPQTKDGYGAHFPKAIPASDSAKDLISKLLVLDIAKRLTADEALEHPWLTGETASDKPLLPKVIENLKSFDSSLKFKNAVLTMMADSLTEAELDVLTDTFKKIDENGDGHITFAEMKKALENKDMKISQDELSRLMKMADVNGDGVLSYEELKLTCVQRKLIAKEERIWAAFCKLDLDGDGKISTKEIQKVLGAEDAKSLIDEVDKNGDGEVDYDEFMSMWHKRAAGGTSSSSSSSSSTSASTSTST
jgi:calcium-dependent protein kinase